jgi:hypothetical protein
MWQSLSDVETRTVVSSRFLRSSATTRTQTRRYDALVAAGVGSPSWVRPGLGLEWAEHENLANSSRGRLGDFVYSGTIPSGQAV